MAGNFIDTNILVYLAASDPVKANRAEDIVREGGSISVQVLNEFTMIVAAALHADYQTLWSEDMQHGMVIDNRLRIVNPFCVE